MRDMLGADHPLVQADPRRQDAGGASRRTGRRHQARRSGRSASSCSPAAPPRSSVDRSVHRGRPPDRAARARAARRSTTTRSSPSSATPTRRSRKPCLPRRATRAYPDATFTLRLSYGAVKGYQEDGKRIEPFTRDSRPVRPRRSARQQAAVHAARQLGQGQEHARPPHAVQLRHHQRHRRRQQRVAGHQRARRARRADLRRQHPVAARLLRLRRHGESRHRGRRARHDRSAAEGVRRRVTRLGAACATAVTSAK